VIYEYPYIPFFSKDKDAWIFSTVGDVEREER